MFKNKIGQRSGASVIIGVAGIDHYRHTVWLCRCDCGRTFNRRNSQFIAKRKKGFCPDCAQKLRAKKHGYSHSSEYASWQSMLNRCHNKNDPSYANYGGRGIVVCERWHDFRNFVADMGDKPDQTFTLERNDVNGSYEITNCCWATRKEQSRNRRATKYVVLNDERVSFMDAWERYGKVSQRTANERLKRGYELMDALTLPLAVPGKKLAAKRAPRL